MKGDATMATVHLLYQHNWSAAGIHTMTMRSKQLWIPGTSTFALLPISCFVSGPLARGLPFSRGEPPGSG
jgi:hypothetical protein